MLAGRLEVLTYDCRGHGDSQRKAMPFTTDLFARDLAELLDHVGWASAAVAGCSLGGCVAQAFAARHPARLSALGLIDTTAWYGPKAPATWRQRVLAARTKGLAGMMEFQVSRWFSDAFRQQHPDVVSAVSAIFVDNDVECYCASCIMLGDVDLRPSQTSIRVPTAIVVGEGDYATPVAMSQQIHESIPGSTLKILPGVRHLTPIEAPQDIASQLLELVARIRT
jgi:3-oxoadipate enol-lactonase